MTEGNTDKAKTVEDDVPEGMRVVSDPDLGLVREEDKAAFEEVCAAVGAGRAVLFVGSGVSSKWYGTWEDLVAELVREARLVRREGEKNPAVLGRCQRALRSLERYDRILRDRFTQQPVVDQKSVLFHIVRANFDAYVTTNFDCAIEKAAEEARVQIGPVYAYPTPYGASDVEGRALLHIHGVIKPDAGEGRVHVVLADTDYEAAYGEESYAGQALADLLVRGHRSVVFCGYGLREPSFFDCIERGLCDLKRAASKLQKNKVPSGGIRRKHFAFLSVPTFPPDENDGCMRYWEDNVEDRLAFLDTKMRQWKKEDVVVEIKPVLYADPYPYDQDEAKRHVYLTILFNELAERYPYVSGTAPQRGST